MNMSHWNEGAPPKVITYIGLKIRKKTNDSVLSNSRALKSVLYKDTFAHVLSVVNGSAL